MVLSCCVYDFECNCMWVYVCVGGCPYWQLLMLPPQAVFGEACHCCCGLAKVNGKRGAWATLLLLTGCQAEAPALSIKPITHSQLTPDSLSVYLAWRLRANRQRQRCRWGLCYWKRGWRQSKSDYECSALFQLRSQRWEQVVGERTLNLWMRRAPGASIQ